MISSYTGLGPGGLTIKDEIFPVKQTCIVGSSHGGHGGYTKDVLESGQPYDKENLTSLLGGSGGEFKFFLLMKYSHVNIRLGLAAQP